MIISERSSFGRNTPIIITKTAWDGFGPTQTSAVAMHYCAKQDKVKQQPKLQSAKLQLQARILEWEIMELNQKMQDLFEANTK